MARTKTVTEGDMAHELGHELGMSHSLNDAAQQLEKSIATVKRYKKILVEVFESDLSKVINSDTGSLTQLGLEQLFVIRDFASKGEPDSYFSFVRSQYPELASSRVAHEPGHELGHELPKALDSLESKSFANDVEITAYEPGVMDLRNDISPVSFDLTSVRGSATTYQGVDDILLFADRVLDGADEAIDEDLARQKADLRKMQNAAEVMRGKRLHLQAKKQLHQQRSSLLQVHLQAAQEDLQAELAEVRG